MTDAITTRAPLALIVAVARNGVIGKGGSLPWHLSEDLRHFKKTTTGHAVIMGRKTYDSIGHPLPKRRNIVVSTKPGVAFPGCETASTLEEAIALARKTDPCPSLYEWAVPLATEIHLTMIDEDVEGDVYFRPDLTDFEEVETQAGQTPGVTFRLLRRRS